MLTNWQEDVSCIRCGATPGQTSHLWEVSPAFWCTSCYEGAFQIGSACGLLCCGAEPTLPVVAVAESLEVEAKARVVWSSAKAAYARSPNVATYKEGIYVPLYVKIWEHAEGGRVSTTHLVDGRFLVIGPRLPALEHEQPPTAPDGTKKKECVLKEEEVEHRDVGVQTAMAGVIPNLDGMWGYDEVRGELVEVIPEGIQEDRKGREKSSSHTADGEGEKMSPILDDETWREVTTSTSTLVEPWTPGELVIIDDWELPVEEMYSPAPELSPVRDDVLTILAPDDDDWAL